LDTSDSKQIMKKINSQESFEKILIISGDGDYKKLVYYLLHKKKLCKILFPSQTSTSFLYRKLMDQYTDCLSDDDIRRKIQLNKKFRRGRLCIRSPWLSFARHSDLPNLKESSWLAL
jgi:hypothetical protein